MEYRNNGKITGSNGGLYTILLDNGGTPLSGRTVVCRARGVFRHEKKSPLVGDSVAVVYDDSSFNAELEPSPEGAGIVIDQINERKNELIRPPLANLDLMFVIMAAKRPEPSLFTADKLISICEFNRIEPVIVIGKCELDRERAAEFAGIYRLAGFRVFVLSCFENEGVDEFADYIKTALVGKTAAFAGLSGVGKSTLLNLVFPELGLSTGEVSRKTERGRHTTRKVELFEACGGFIADTPGFSMLDFERFDFFTKEDLPSTFREFDDCIGQCRYTKCTHTKEEGCAVLEKLREGRIAPSRHESFLALYDILKQKHSWDTK